MKRIFFLTACAVMLSSCSLAPPYKFQPGEPTASLDVKNLLSPEMCMDGRRHVLEEDGEGHALVPAGKRITILSTLNVPGYPVSWTCRAGKSFIPIAGSKYFGNFESKDQHCRVEVYKEDAGNRTGLALDWTLAPAICGRD
jgi:hypothetical protein